MGATKMARRAAKAMRDKEEAHVKARQRGMCAGLDVNAAQEAARRAMLLWDPEYTEREWHELVDEEIRRAKEALTS